MSQNLKPVGTNRTYIQQIKENIREGWEKIKVNPFTNMIFPFEEVSKGNNLAALPYIIPGGGAITTAVKTVSPATKAVKSIKPSITRLYRVQGSRALPASVDGTQAYRGMWFTDNANKPTWYASNAVKAQKKNGIITPIELQVVDIPTNQLNTYKASNIIKDPTVEYEAVEDFLIPLDYPREHYTLKGITGNVLKDTKYMEEFIRNLPSARGEIQNFVKGNEAVKMFKEYGGAKLLKDSKVAKLIRQYVPEARERYGLVGNNSISDEEIAEAIYKQVKELGENTAALNSQGEPLILFRGDTDRYLTLKQKPSPSQMAGRTGDMDNSLGTLFLSEPSETYRYLITANDFPTHGPSMSGSSTGAAGITSYGKRVGGRSGVTGEPIAQIPSGSTKLITYNTPYGFSYSKYKLPATYSESGVNDLNAFIVRTPAVRDATREIGVTQSPTELLVKQGDFYGVAGDASRESQAQHYTELLRQSKENNQGLLISRKNSQFRDEHVNSDYYVVPNFNIGNVKHILPYDLRIPRDWSDPNIYRSILLPIIGAGTAAEVVNQKIGGKLNYLNYLKKGGIHIKPENKGKFTSYCGGKVTEECIQKGKHSPSATIRKRATFAANARKWAGGAVATRLSPFKQDPSKIYEQYLSFDPYENDLSLYNPNPQDSTEGEQEKVKVEQKKVEVPAKTTATKPGSWKEFRDTLIAALQKKGFTGEAAQTLVAQMGLETGHGKHMSGDYNYGNITAGKNWSGKTVQKVDNHNGKTYSFRSYDNLDQAMNDYVNLLTRSYGVTPQDTKDQIYAKLTGGNQRGRKWAEAQNYTQNIDSVYNMYWK